MPKRQLRYNGITQITVVDGEEGVFAAFLEFAIKHTQNDSALYEKAVRLSNQIEQKNLFLQLGYRKNEIVCKLKMQRSDQSIMHSSEKIIYKNPQDRNRMEIDSAPLLSIEDALNFALQRECRTIEQYQKLEKIMTHDSTKALFEFLVNSQYAVLEFLSPQLASSIAVRC